MDNYLLKVFAIHKFLTGLTYDIIPVDDRDWKYQNQKLSTPAPSLTY